MKKSDIECSSADAVAECTSLGRGVLTTLGMSMTDVARSIQPMTGRPVFARTGLTGLYAFSLKFSSTRSGPPLKPTSGTQLSDIFAALQEQLGLKLESARGTVNVLVIEHIEPPTEN